MKNKLKSVGAVLAGVVVIVVLSIATDAILEKFGLMGQGYLDNDWHLALALTYRTVYAFIGGYVTAALAPSNAKKHIIALEIIGTIMGTLGVFAGWNLSHHWYPIALVFTSFAAVWYGGKLKIEKK